MCMCSASENNLFRLLASKSNILTLVRSILWSLSLVCVYSDEFSSFIVYFLACSFILTFKRLPVCPTYDALQSLQLILYTTHALSQIWFLSLPNFMMLLSLFFVLYITLVLCFLKKIFMKLSSSFTYGKLINFFLLLFYTVLLCAFLNFFKRFFICSSIISGG